MRIYRADGTLGCLFGLLILFSIFYLLVFFGKVLLTTPLGLALLATLLVWYYLRPKRPSGGGPEIRWNQEPGPERERENPFEERNETGFNRNEAVDVVHYEEVKDDTDK